MCKRSVAGSTEQEAGDATRVPASVHGCAVLCPCPPPLPGRSAPEIKAPTIDAKGFLAPELQGVPPPQEASVTRPSSGQPPQPRLPAPLLVLPLLCRCLIRSF